MTNFMRLKMLVFCAASVSLILIGCGPEPPQEPIILEQNTSIEVLETTEIPFENCLSEGDLITEQRVDKPFNHEVDLVRAPNSDQNPQSLRESVREHYGVEEIASIASAQVVASVPSGFIYTYIIEWSETWREGNIEIGENDENPEATYRFLEDLTGAVIEINQATCP